MNAADVRLHNFVECLIRDVLRLAEKGVQRGITNKHVDFPERCYRLLNQLLKLILMVNVSGNTYRLISSRCNFSGDFVTRILIATRDHNRRTLLCHPLCYRLG